MSSPSKRNERPRAMGIPMLGAQRAAERNSYRLQSDPSTPADAEQPKFTGYATRRIPRHTRTPFRAPCQQIKTAPRRTARSNSAPAIPTIVRTAQVRPGAAPPILRSFDQQMSPSIRSLPVPALRCSIQQTTTATHTLPMPCTQAKHKTGPGYQHVLHSCCLRQTCVMRMVVRMCSPADRR